MTIIKKYFLCMLLVLSVGAEIPEPDRYADDLKAYLEAPFKSDYEHIKVHMPTAEREDRSGGKEHRFLNYLEQQKTALKKTNSSITDIVIGEGHSYAQSGDNYYFLVDVSFVRTTYGREFKLNNTFLVAHEFPIIPFKFLNATRAGRKKVASYYQDLPLSILNKIPELQKLKYYNKDGKEIEVTKTEKPPEDDPVSDKEGAKTPAENK